MQHREEVLKGRFYNNGVEEGVLLQVFLAHS